MLDNDNCKPAAADSVWFYYGESLAHKITGAALVVTANKARRLKFNTKPVHKEVYMYGIAYEQDSFQYMLDYVLERAGIYKDPSFDITSDNGDRLSLATSHPEKEVIEKILNADRSLYDTYRRIVNHYDRMYYIIKGEAGVGRDFVINVSNEGYSIRVD